MTDSSNTIDLSHHHLSLGQQAVAMAAFAAAAAVFLTAGWDSLAPDDPQGALSLLTRSDALVALGQAAGLAAVTAAIATLIAGRLLIDIGVFSVALGLASAALLGRTAEYLLISFADSPRDLPSLLAASREFQSGLSARLAVESLAWGAVILLAILVSAPLSGLGSKSTGPGRARQASGWIPAGWDIPFLGTLLSRRSRATTTTVRQGATHTLVAIGVSVLAYQILFASQSMRTIAHGQAIFSVMASVWLGTWIAFRISPVRSTFWAIMAVGLFTVVGFVWSAVTISASPGSGPAHMPQTQFLRVLPVQFLSVGTATAVATFWWIQAGTAFPDERPSEKKQSAS